MFGLSLTKQEHCMVVNVHLKTHGGITRLNIFQARFTIGAKHCLHYGAKSLFCLNDTFKFV